MTQDDIIRMAQEACETTNWKPGLGNELGNEHVVEFLARFARLVYEATFRDANIAASKTILDAAVLEEREACAKVCADKAKQTFSGQCAVWGDYFARAIRARGQS